MRSAFLGQFTPTKDDFDKLWKSCAFVVDANILLNLYRYSDQTRDEYLKALRGIKARLWLPHQVANEYFANRLSTIGQQEKAYKDVIANVETLRKELEDTTRHPFVSKALMDQANSVLDQLKKELEENRNSHVDRISNDSIQESLAEIFSKRVGIALDEKKLNELFEMGTARYKEKCPPGYMDNRKGEGGDSINERCRKFGDLLVWFQVMGIANDNKTDVIFVTDDNKEDWWTIFKGKTVGPRPELREEFHRETGQIFYMYSSDTFLERVTEFLNQKVALATLSEVRDLRAHKDDSKLTLKSRQIHRAPNFEYDMYSEELLAHYLKRGNILEQIEKIERTLLYCQDHAAPEEIISGLTIEAEHARFNLHKVEEEIRRLELLEKSLSLKRARAESFGEDCQENEPPNLKSAKQYLSALNSKLKKEL